MSTPSWGAVELPHPTPPSLDTPKPDHRPANGRQAFDHRRELAIGCERRSLLTSSDPCAGCCQHRRSRGDHRGPRRSRGDQGTRRARVWSTRQGDSRHCAHHDDAHAHPFHVKLRLPESPATFVALTPPFTMKAPRGRGLPSGLSRYGRVTRDHASLWSGSASASSPSIPWSTPPWAPQRQGRRSAPAR